MTEAQVVRVLQELGKLWREYAEDDASDYYPIGVLNLRFGLIGGPPHSFEQVAEMLKIPPERAREIENDVLGRLARAASIV